MRCVKLDVRIDIKDNLTSGSVDVKIYQDYGGMSHDMLFKLQDKITEFILANLDDKCIQPKA